MDTEQLAYEVPGRQLGWRVSQLQAQGLPYEVQPVGGVYIILVQQPIGAQPFAYQPVRRRVNPGGMARDMARYLLPLAIVAFVLAVAVMFVMLFLTGDSDTVTAETGGMRLDPVTGRMVDDSPWAWLTQPPQMPDWWPWPRTEPEPEPGGFRWPWDAAADSLADAAASAQATATAVVAGVIVLALVLVLFGRRR